MVGEAGAGGGDGDGLTDAFLRAAPPEPASWSRRYIQNVELLKSGQLVNIALVAHRLEARKRDKGLSGGEQRMLARAQGILESEAFLGLPDGWEGDNPDDGDDGGAGVREPRHPSPTGGAGPQARNPPAAPGDRTNHLDQQ